MPQAPPFRRRRRLRALRAERGLVLREFDGRSRELGRELPRMSPSISSMLASNFSSAGARNSVSSSPASAVANLAVHLFQELRELRGFAGDKSLHEYLMPREDVVEAQTAGHVTRRHPRSRAPPFDGRVRVAW
jgi:hypothetical protein